MAGLNDYLPAQAVPGSAEWLKMIGQESVMAPDQAQIRLAQAMPPQGVQDDATAQSARLSSVANTPAPKEETAPQSMVQNMVPGTPGQGLSAYLPPATRAMDRSLIDQYKGQAQQSMNEQRSGISQLEQMRNDISGRETPFDWSNVGSFVDMLNGQFGQKTNLHKDAMDVRGLTQDQKDAALVKLQEQIQGAKGNMSKESLQATQQMMQMLHQNDQTNLMAQHYANIEGAAQTRGDAFKDRNTIARENQAKAVGDLFDKDPILRPQLDRLNQISLDKHTLEMGGTITPQVMDEIATGIASALSGGKGAGLGMSEKQELVSLGKDMAARRAYFENKPYNALSPENSALLSKILNRLEAGYGKSIARRADQLKQGRGYPSNPLAQKSLEDKHSYYSTFGSQADTPMNAQDEYHGVPDDEVKRQYDALMKGK